MQSEDNFIQVGWFVVGDSDAKFGERLPGDVFEPLQDPAIKYWVGRGYKLIPCFIKKEDS